jgi:predicted nucleotidyltransferase
MIVAGVVHREEGIQIARSVKELLMKRGFPVRRVLLFGSVAKGTAHGQSDIDIAVIADAFKESRIDERVDVHLASMEIDHRVETITLRPDDLQIPFFALAGEIRRTGIEV